MNFTSGADVSELLSLDHIRNQLIRLEDTIIFLLIERAQFAYNEKIYLAGAFKDELNFSGSWLEWFLFEIESFHAKARRYTSPDEHAFTPLEQLPQPIIKPQSLPSLLHQPAAKHPSVNVNHRILEFYIQQIVPGITSATKIAKGKAVLEDDGNYGSAATRDVEVLQALSRRIHFGMFVSESKFLLAPHDFIPHILDPNPDKLAGLITKPAVEAKLLIRLANKARVYGGEMDADGKVVEVADEEMAARGKIDLATIVSMYKDWVIPLTKDVEVDYLLHRLDGVPQSQIDEWMKGRKE
ncbi:chorismate mutase [Kwoniella dejecticola CBS 10117]|uniref:Chorismate mutase n=1 Tax=Kwoniella dejecticola CBS 10117 TaxID=1296121 RepID=A0A1A5ZVZ2_9TREE|nr:chorismate mutase [Kwoniella dejecticola CBS 10117]OBR81981.1 chorismate mutase [Kwoniella dejecticola CBS 10117]